MLNPFDFWMVKEWPVNVLEIVTKYHDWAMSLVYDYEIIYSNREYFESYEDKDILIVGGGPSTNEYLSDQFLFDKSYDYTWSCNHFFLNKVLINHRIDLAMIMPGVNLNSGIFNLKTRLDDTLIGIELHDKWLNNNDLKSFVNKNKDRMFFSHTRFFGKLGIGARMVILAAALKANSISFIGFDGPVKGHSFQVGKNELPSEVAANNAYEIYDNQYNILWDYLAEKFPATQIISIDKTNLFHKKVWNL